MANEIVVEVDGEITNPYDADPEDIDNAWCESGLIETTEEEVEESN